MLSLKVTRPYKPSSVFNLYDVCSELAGGVLTLVFEACTDSSVCVCLCQEIPALGNEVYQLIWALLFTLNPWASGPM